jgi:hypothetical protein
MSPHAISNLRNPAHAEFSRVERGVGRNETNPINTKVESLCDVPFFPNVLDISKNESLNNYNLLIPQIDVFNFISASFNCKKCKSAIKQDSLQVERIGAACNLFWRCSNVKCSGSSKVLAKASTMEASGKFRRRHPELPAALSDYDINRLVLACQQSGGGSRMTSTFMGVLSISRRSIWKDCFTKVEELIGKAQILLGEKILSDNLREEIALSPMNTTINRAKVSIGPRLP